MSLDYNNNYKMDQSKETTDGKTTAFRGRDDKGLLLGFDHPILEDGSVNWRACVKPEYIFPNKRLTTETDIAKLPDSQLVISLAGLRELAHLRGFENVEYRNLIASRDYAAVICSITWAPNFETFDSPVIFEALADAHEGNTEGFAGQFLASIASNRAFARCVRNFLRIHICSDEEMSNITPEAPPVTGGTDIKNALVILDKLMRQKGIDFGKVKEKLTKGGLSGAENFTTIEEIPAPNILELIEMLKKFQPAQPSEPKKRGRKKKTEDYTTSNPVESTPPMVETTST